MDKKAYRALLDEQDWGELYKRLLDFACARCGKHGKAQAKDLAQEAITRVYGSSKWDPAQEPDLLRYLMSVVNSLRANERTRHATTRTSSIADEKTRRAALRVADDKAPSEATIADQDVFTRRLALLRERMASDPKVLLLLECMERGIDSPDDLCAALEWSRAQLLAVRRRMFRAAALVARDLGGANGDDEPLLQPDERDEEDEGEVA
ncbi:MAG TPA: hypothetical protein VGI39_04440 [Polyangiaceae bacterium]|jgi:hypothetical protein